MLTQRLQREFLLFVTLPEVNATLLFPTLLEETVLYRTLKGSISAMYLEPLKGSIHS